jgi:hypothetical protein
MGGTLLCIVVPVAIDAHSNQSGNMLMQVVLIGLDAILAIVLLGGLIVTWWFPKLIIKE